MDNDAEISPSPLTGAVPRGYDFLTTVRAVQLIDLPAEMLGPGMEPFRDYVTFVGARLEGEVGNADTVMERLADAPFGEPSPTRLVAFANVSAAPIELRGTGRVAGFYDLYVTLSPTVESPGRTTYRSDDGVSGTFESEVSLSPVFELRPLGGGDSIFIDTGQTPVPGFPMRLGSTGGQWSLRPPVPNPVRGPGDATLFYTQGVLISAVSNEGNPLAECLKQQAEAGAPERTRFARIDFGIPARGAKFAP